jgi:hypothetical protein
VSPRNKRHKNTWDEWESKNEPKTPPETSGEDKKISPQSMSEKDQPLAVVENNNQSKIKLFILKAKKPGKC